MTNVSSICLTPDCSGRGSCMIPDGAANNISICICDFPWSGKTDILNYDGYDCVDLGLLRQMLYGWVAIRHLYNLKNIYFAWKCQWNLFQSIKDKRPKKGPIVKHWWQMLSLRVLIAFVFVHFMLIYFCLAMAFGYGVIGENAVASMAFALQAIVGTFATIAVNVTTLKALLSGVGMDKKGETIVRFVTIANLAAVTVYCVALFSLFTFLPIYSASMTEPPNESIVVPALLITRNMTVIYLFAYSAWLGSFTSAKVRAVIAERSSSDQTPGGRKNKKSNEKIKLLLLKLDRAGQIMKKNGIIATILYTTFCLPWLHPFQGYLYTFTFMQMTGPGHPARVYLDENRSSGLGSSRVIPGKLEESSASTSISGLGDGGESNTTSNIQL